MDKNEDSGSPGWSASFFMQTTEDVARGIAAAASAATTCSPRPSVIFSSKEDGSNSQLQKLQRQVTRVLKGFSSPPQIKRGAYNPEILTSQKRQWARFQLQSMDHRIVKEPSRIFESLVVVGLHPNSDVKTLQKQFLQRNSDSMKQSRTTLNYQQQVYPGINLEPQVLFVYPPEKQLPLKYRDLVSFCFPGGLEIHAVERTPSMSELSEILLGQEHLKQSSLSFVFRCLQVAEDSTSTLYGCCILVEEIIQKPSTIISMLSDERSPIPTSSRRIITAPRCYCILSRLPFFDLHFGILKSIFIEERLQRLTEGIDVLNLRTQEGCPSEGDTNMASTSFVLKDRTSEEIIVGHLQCSEASSDASAVMEASRNNEHSEDGQISNRSSSEGDCKNSTFSQDQQGFENGAGEGESAVLHNNGVFDMVSKVSEKNFPEAVLPLLRFHRYESSESSTSLQGSPCDEWNLRSVVVEAELEEPSSSGREESNDHDDILAWAKANSHGCLQIICEYYQLRCPPRGSSVTFHPLEHLHPLEYHRPSETLLHVAGSAIDLRNCSTSLELAEAHNALLVEEEATALSVWTVACVCGSLRLESILTMFAGALLEKQIVVVCSNLGILSAAVLSIIPLIRPYQWQSLLMPVLPSDMLDFLDAPVPYIVGIRDKTAEVQSKLANTIIVDANKNQVKSPSLPQLPQQKQLVSSLSPYYATLVGESYLARKRPVYECTDTQVEAAKGFLAVLRSYLDSLCSNLRSHTITNVQSNDDKVSLLLKESFIDSFPSRDRPFMKLFVDTQLFSMHTDLVLSFYQKD